MLVPYEVAPIERLEGPERVASALARVACLEPSVLPYDGTTPAAQVVDGVRQQLASPEFLRKVSGHFGTQRLGWHFDAFPSNDDSLDFTVQPTLMGEVKARMFKARPGFWLHTPVFGMLPPDFLEHLLESQLVDDEFVDPCVRVATMGPEDVLVFPGVAVHNFENVRTPRVSRGYGGQLLRSRHPLSEDAFVQS